MGEGAPLGLLAVGLSLGRGAPQARCQVGWRRSAPAPSKVRSPLQAASRGSSWASLGELASGEAALARKGVRVARGLGLRRRFAEPYGDATLNAKVGAFAFPRSCPRSAEDRRCWLFTTFFGFKGLGVARDAVDHPQGLHTPSLARCKPWR